MNQYIDWKEHKKEQIKQFDFGFFWNYNDQDQYQNMMNKWNLNPESDFCKITRINHFTFLPEKEAVKYYNLLNQQKSEFYQYIKNDKSGYGFIKDMFLANLWNSKYLYEHDLNKIFILCDLELEMMKQENVKNGFISALTSYLDANDVIEELPFYIHEFEYQLDQILEEYRKQKIMEEPIQYAAKNYLYSNGYSLEAKDRMQQLLDLKCKFDFMIQNKSENEFEMENLNQKVELMENLYNSFSSIERPEWLDTQKINEYSMRLNFPNKNEKYSTILDFINVYNEFNEREYDMKQSVISNWECIPLAMTEGGYSQFQIQVNLNFFDKQIHTEVQIEDETVVINPIKFESTEELIAYFQDLDFEWLVNEGLFFCEQVEEGIIEQQR